MPKLIIYFSIFILSGCSPLFNISGLVNLKRYGNNQDEIKDYIEKQEGLFFKLKEDINNNRLKTGTSKKQILSKYGEFILSNSVKDETDINEIILYRHPTQYFSSDKVYLYFDKEKKLRFWKLISAQKQN